MGWNGVVWGNGQTYENTYSYDPAGKLTTASNSISTITRTYYPTTGRFKTESTTNNLSSLPVHSLQYAYDNDGRVTEVTLDPPSDDPSVDYDFIFGYDAMGRMETIQDFHTTSVDYQYHYDRASNVTQRFNWLGGDRVDYVPDNLNRIAERDITLQNAIDQHLTVWSTEDYFFDPMDRVTLVTRTENGSGSSDSFGYNKLGEMTSASYTTGGGTPTPTPTGTPTPTPTATPTPSPPAPATPTIYDCGALSGQPLNVFMETATQGATIFYTRNGPSCPANPTHNGSTPTNGTVVYNPASPPQVVSGAVAYFKALAWGNGHSDSPVSAVISRTIRTSVHKRAAGRVRLPPPRRRPLQH